MDSKALDGFPVDAKLRQNNFLPAAWNAGKEDGKAPPMALSSTPEVSRSRAQHPIEDFASVCPGRRWSIAIGIVIVDLMAGR